MKLLPDTFLGWLILGVFAAVISLSVYAYFALKEDPKTASPVLHPQRWTSKPMPCPESYPNCKQQSIQLPVQEGR